MAIHVLLVVELFLWSMLCVKSQDSDGKLTYRTS